MFTGIVEEVGVVRRLSRTGQMARLDVAAVVAAEGVGMGASVSVNGACLTVVDLRPDRLSFDVGPETLEVTALGDLAEGDRVNLERPLRFGGALGGHLVLGHVDGIGTVAAVTRVESTMRVRIALPDPGLEPLLIPKGSVAVDGVSLTVAALGAEAFEVMLIPYTLAATTLAELAPGRRVNIEGDVIGKYLQRALALRGIA
jgi:riboflavin synthase